MHCKKTGVLLHVSRCVTGIVLHSSLFHEGFYIIRTSLYSTCYMIATTPLCNHCYSKKSHGMGKIITHQRSMESYTTRTESQHMSQEVRRHAHVTTFTTGKGTFTTHHKNILTIHITRGMESCTTRQEVKRHPQHVTRGKKHPQHVTRGKGSKR